MAEQGRGGLILLSGMSGSGKTTALHALEDIGWFCVDNLPAPLVDGFLRVAADNDAMGSIAIAIDVRGSAVTPDPERDLAALTSTGRDLQVLFLECSDDRVQRRYNETRRRHPLIAIGSASTLSEAIERERQWLGPIRAMATSVIDTGALTVHDLKRQVHALFGARGQATLSVQLQSFGFRYGVPADADYVFDVRFVPNPYFVQELRAGSGLEDSVSSFVLQQPAARKAMDRIGGLLVDFLPLHQAEGKTSVSVAIGCTGGRHRSVAIVEALGRLLTEQAQAAAVQMAHRDVRRAGPPLAADREADD